MFGGEKEVRCAGTKVVYNRVIAGGSWFHDFAGELVGIDYGERVRRGGEKRGDGGFAGCDGAG
jgi:hypothetical protein